MTGSPSRHQRDPWYFDPVHRASPWRAAAAHPARPGRRRRHRPPDDLDVAARGAGTGCCAARPAPRSAVPAATLPALIEAAVADRWPIASRSTRPGTLLTFAEGRDTGQPARAPGPSRAARASGDLVALLLPRSAGHGAGTARGGEGRRRVPARRPRLYPEEPHRPDATCATRPPPSPSTPRAEVAGLLAAPPDETPAHRARRRRPDPPPPGPWTTRPMPSTPPGSTGTPRASVSPTAACAAFSAAEAAHYQVAPGDAYWLRHAPASTPPCWSWHVPAARRPAGRTAARAAARRPARRRAAEPSAHAHPAAAGRARHRARRLPPAPLPHLKTLIVGADACGARTRRPLGPAPPHGR
ncbi:hypothetical protein LT493_15635 [Streptomyces tricolor]|nr:hypothetical protein [Streptomyces tricolor]